jgi:hypothetical protein
MLRRPTPYPARRPSRLRGLAAAALLVLAAACGAAPQPDASWWKGNLHAHSLWSDGDDYPEMIAAWYRENGYHFLSLTEHDLLHEGERWLDIDEPDAGWPPRNASARAGLEAYRTRFGVDWVQERRDGDRRLVRLRRQDEFRHMFEAPGEFLLLTGEEITDREGAHVNAFNLERAILPRGGESTAERTRNNLAAVEEARLAGGRPTVAIVNHPNFLWTLTAEEIAAIPGARLFEVRSGHTMVNDAGDALRAGTERIWDVILSLRHAVGGEPIFAVATDDAHDFRADSDTISRPGRGWVMVRAPALAPDALVTALAAGDFYASTGVTLRDVVTDGRRMRITIEGRPGVTYRTQFIGTRASASLESEPVLDSDGTVLRTTRRYGSGVGEVLAETAGTVAEYRFRGDERYVRAKVTASVPQVDPTTGKVMPAQSAWTQPVFRR